MSAFVFEHPDRPTSSRKRRPHVIVACDNCRQKKLKCKPRQGQTVCDHCDQTGVECTFVDRKRDLQARENDILAAFVESGMRARLSGESLATVASDGPSALTGRGEVSSTCNVQAGPIAITSDLFSTRLTAALKPMALPDTHGANDLALAAPVVLFAPESPLGEPHHALMSQFIEAFFCAHGRAFRFMSYERTVNDYLLSILPASVANLLASLAIPYCVDTTRFSGFDIQQASMLYAEQAKNQIAAQWATPSIYAICALVLVSHFDQINGNASEARGYMSRALEMGTELNLGEEATIQQLGNNEEECQHLRALWDTIRPYDWFDAQPSLQ